MHVCAKLRNSPARIPNSTVRSTRMPVDTATTRPLRGASLLVASLAPQRDPPRFSNKISVLVIMSSRAARTFQMHLGDPDVCMRTSARTVALVKNTSLASHFPWQKQSSSQPLEGHGQSAELKPAQLRARASALCARRQAAHAYS